MKKNVNGKRSLHSNLNIEKKLQFNHFYGQKREFAYLKIILYYTVSESTTKKLGSVVRHTFMSHVFFFRFEVIGICRLSQFSNDVVPRGKLLLYGGMGI